MILSFNSWHANLQLLFLELDGQNPSLTSSSCQTSGLQWLLCSLLEKSSISKLFSCFNFMRNLIASLSSFDRLVHHQLCIFPVFSCFSNIFTLFQLLYIRTLSIDAPLIINFNYDFWFLRILFRKSRIVTILNDDFVLD